MRYAQKPWFAFIAPTAGDLVDIVNIIKKGLEKNVFVMAFPSNMHGEITVVHDIRVFFINLDHYSKEVFSEIYKWLLTAFPKAKVFAYSKDLNFCSMESLNEIGYCGAEKVYYIDTEHPEAAVAAAKEALRIIEGAMI